MLSRPAVKALVVAAVLGAFLLLDFFVLQPMQAAGRLDAAAALPTRLATMVALPGLMAGRMLYISSHHVVRGEMTAFYLVAAGVTAALCWLVAWRWFTLRRRARARRGALTRRAFFKRAAGYGLTGGGALLGGYSVLLEPAWLRVQRLRLPLDGLPPELAGFRLVHLTDLHLGRFITAAHLLEVVRLTNRERPDLVLLTGDYVHGSPLFIRPVFQLLTGLRSRLGTAGVLGNHDHWEDAGLCRREMHAAGIRLLDNRRLWISGAGLTTGSAPSSGLCVAGVGDYWEGRQDLDILADAPAQMPRLLLSHNPDFAEGQMARTSKHRVDLMLAGHTHGGQVRLPGTRSLITPSRHGSKYAHGMVQGPRFPVFVSTGLGMTILPVRMLVRPEIVVIELVSGEAVSSTAARRADF